MGMTIAMGTIAARGDRPWCSTSMSCDAVYAGYVKLPLGMHSGWIRAFVLLLVIALFANIQCYGTCGPAPCNSAHESSSDSCHHDESSPENKAACTHQHSDLAGPQAGLALHKVGANTMPVLMACSVTLRLAAPKSVNLLPADRGSPPGQATCSRISVLRI